MKDAGDDADDAGGDVVGHDAARIKGVEALWTPGWLHGLQVTAEPIGIAHPHARTEDSGEVEGSEAEAGQTGQ